MSPEAFDRIELLLLDVDGVLTDGRVTYTEAGDEFKSFHVRDGSALRMWSLLGKQTAVISGRSSQAVVRRMRELGIERVIQGQSVKLPALEGLLKELDLTADRVCAMGDDLPDLPILARCGLAACPADACEEVKGIAHFVSPKPGGSGAVRDTIEWLMKSTGRWTELVQHLRDGTPIPMPAKGP